MSLIIKKVKEHDIFVDIFFSSEKICSLEIECDKYDPFVDIFCSFVK